MPDIYAERRQTLARIAKDQGLGAIALVPGANFTYVSGLVFHLMERPTVLFQTAGGSVVAIIPELEREKWTSVFPEAQTFYWQDSDGYQDAFAAAAAALEGQMIGVEGMRMRVFEGEALRRHFQQGAVVDAEPHLTDLRLSKSAAEIAALQRAIQISETALGETLETVRTGQTERQIAAVLKMRMLANGAEGFSFDPIVLAGGNAANPHGVPGDTVLRPGDALLIDYGASFDGFHADITRTFFCEHVSDRHAAIYNTVLAANATGRTMAAPTLTAHDLDLAVTAVLAASPFADMIMHKTGHGLGMDIHEAPHIMKGNHKILIPGTVFTVEPGLYRSGEIGVRIEDNVVTTDTGATSLTGFPRELTLVGLPK
ncbi:MAG: Xaa-Pro peptidase family protein [bacterium]